MSSLFVVSNRNTKTENNFNTTQQVINFIKGFITNDFWDETINDCIEYVELFGREYKTSEVLKRIDIDHYKNVCEMFWKQFSQDFCKELEELEAGDIKTFFDFIIIKCEEQ